MTKDEVMKQMQDFFRHRKSAEGKAAAVPESAGPDIEDSVLELADVFDEFAETLADAAAVILDLTADLRNEQKESLDTDMAARLVQDEEDVTDDEEVHDAGIYSVVLYAVPGEAPRLMTAKEALDQYDMDEMDFNCFEIREGLYLHYMTSAFEDDDDEITVMDPVYIARVDMRNNRMHDITVKDYEAAMNFLAEHMSLMMDADGRMFHGYVLPNMYGED